MKKLLTVSHGGRFSVTSTRTGIFLLVSFTLVASLWIATLPVALALLMTPTEMIEQGLPPGKNVRNATKAEFLFALCAAVKRHRPDSPAIAKVAVVAHHEYAGDIIETIIRCASAEEPDCEFVGAVVAAAVAAAPDSSSGIADGALAAAPNCADAIQQALAPVPGEGPGFESAGPTSALPPPGSVGGGGGGFNPQGQPILVCDNGTEVQVLPNQLSTFLSSHAGSAVGACQPTPVTNK